MDNQTLTRKVPMRVKIGMGFGFFAKKITDYVFASYMLYFYTNVLRIDPVFSSSMILLAKAWDIINDPMMGAIIDRTKNRKEGTCRFYIKYFSVPLGIVFMLMLALPDMSDLGTLIWITVTYVLTGMICTAVFIPVSTLVGRVTTDPVERTGVSQVMNIITICGSLLTSSYTMKLVKLFGGEDMRAGFAKLGALYGAIIVVCLFLTYFLTQGYEPVDTAANAQSVKKSPSLGSVLHALGQNWVWLLAVSTLLLTNISFSLEGAVLPFYFQYNFANGDDLYPVYSACTMLMAILPLLFLKPFAKRLGNAGTAGLGCILNLTGYLLRFVLHDGSVVIMAAGWCVAGFGQGLFGATLLLNIFDAMVYGEWKTGVKNEAILMSGYSAAGKIGVALGGPIAGYLLKLVPFVEAAPTQEESVLSFFFHISTLGPVVLSLAAAIILMTVTRKNEKRVPQMRAELEARAQASGE